MRKVFVFLAGAIVMALCLLPLPSKAAFNGGEEDINLYLRVEVSKDSGATWFCYAADGGEVGQSLEVSPGDNLLFRGKVWSNSEVTPYNIDFSTEVDNAQYLNNVGDWYQDDADANGIPFSGTIGGTVYLSTVENLVSTVNSGYESGTFTASVKSDAPDGTVIMGYFNISAVHGRQFNRNNFLVNKAYAQEVGAPSVIRLVVNNPGAQATTVTDLPSTGSSDFPYELVIGAGAIICYFVGRKIWRLKTK